MLDKMENLWKTFDNINSWIINCDSKSTILFGFIGALGLFFLNDFMISKTLLSNLFFILFLATYSLSIIYLLKSIFPNVVKIYDSNLFFGSIGKKSYELFKKDISQNDYSLDEDLKKQIHANSVIAIKKFSSFKKAFIFLLHSFIIYIFYKICLFFVG